MGFADTFVIGAALFVGIPLVLGILVRLGGKWLPGWVPPLVAVSGAVAIALALSTWLDRSGATTTGVVVRKDETLWGSRAGQYMHHVSMWVRFRPHGARDSVLTEVGAGLAEFDTLRAGGPVRVRYLPKHPSFARLQGRTTLSVVRGLVPPGGGQVVWIAAGVLVVLLSWTVLGRWGPGRAVAGAVTLIVAAAGLTAAYSLRPPPPLRTPVETTTGRLQSIDRIRDYFAARRSRDYSRLAVPYDLVGIRLLPAGGTDSVLGVDAVDTASTRGLRSGALVRVRYAARDPRRIELVGATRTFYGRDNASMVYLIAILAALAGLWLAARAVMRRAGARLQRELAQARGAAGRS